MSLVDLLATEAEQRGLKEPGKEVDLAEAFCLVRDMPYQRASDRQPETLIREWQGTCSGKHYLLKALFAEMGYRSQVMACTSIQPIEANLTRTDLRDLWEKVDGRFVDVHNYLVLDTPQGGMVVDATWPADYKKFGLIVNEDFILGKDQHIASPPQQTWVVPEDGNPQTFKEELLSNNFTTAELEFREAFILALGDWLRGEV
jgi:hypothetical protein